MKQNHLFAFFLSLLILPFNALAQKTLLENSISPKDLELIHGKWQGTLTYRDYTSGKPFSMPVEVVIENGKNEFELTMQMVYPKEPKANNKNKLVISKDSKLIDKRPIISRTINSDNEHEFITEYAGKDGNNRQKALIRHTYTISRSHFKIIKEVKFDDETKWLLRNEFNYQRSN